MHELSIAQAIVRTVVDSTDGALVESVAVTVGSLSGVVPSALEFCWQIATDATPLAGSRLEIEYVPLSIYCAPCACIVQPDLGFVCPDCGGLSGDVRSGRELEIRSARLHDTVRTTQT